MLSQRAHQALDSHCMKMLSLSHLERPDLCVWPHLLCLSQPALSIHPLAAAPLGTQQNSSCSCSQALLRSEGLESVVLFSLPFFGSCTCWHGFVSLWSWGCGKGGGEEGRPGPALAQPHFSQSLTCRAGQWLEFPMACVGCYLVKLDTANCAKESHQADIQHQLKEGKRSCVSQAAKRPSFPQKHKAWGLVCPLMNVFSVVVPT